MNSVIEAQQTFTEQFGGLNLSDLLAEVTLPHFTREYMEMQEFIDAHQDPAPIVIPIKTTQYQNATKFEYNG